MALFTIVKDTKNSAICQPNFWRTKMISGLSQLSHFKTSFARATDWKFSEHAYMPEFRHIEDGQTDKEIEIII